MNKNILVSAIAFLFLLGISIPIILPYFHKGYFPTQDGEWAVVRAAEMFREVRDKQIPPRYSGALNFSYGYPLFNFTYPLPYYLATILHIFKFGFIDSVKFLFAASVVFSGFFMFLASKTFWKSFFAGLVSAILYIYLPYRLVDLYVRGSLGESISFVFFALILWCITKLLENPKSKLITIIAAISYGSLIMAHNIMAVYFSIFLGTLMVGFWFFGRKQTLFAMIKFIILGIGLSCFFWFPALFEKNLILLSKIPIADRARYFITLQQFIFSPWGYGDPATVGGFTYQLGFPQLVLFLCTCIFLVYSYFKKKKSFQTLDYKIAVLCILVSLGAFLLMFSPFEIFWKLPLLKEINFPWTFLGLLGFTVSFLCGFLATIGRLRFVIFVIAVTSIPLFLQYAKPQYYNNRNDNYYLTNDATTTASSELMPLWVKDFPTMRPLNKVQLLTGKGTISAVSSSSKLLRFNANISSSSVIQINTIYYPGWTASVDGRNVITRYSNSRGVMDILVPSGNHAVKLSFSETPQRLVSDIVSLVTLLIITGWYIKPKLWKKR